MSGKWAGSTRSATLPIDWPALRKRILDRDGNACTKDVDGHPCGAPATHVDHIVPHHLGGGNEQSNLAAMCRAHHAVKSSREGNAARPRAKRPIERHPGLIG